VRPHETITVYDGQPICLMEFFQNTGIPATPYGQAANNYQGQDGPKLAKFFANVMEDPGFTTGRRGGGAGGGAGDGAGGVRARPMGGGGGGDLMQPIPKRPKQGAEASE
jgi:hypothetical protein